MEIIDSNFLIEAIDINPKSEFDIKYYQYADNYGYWVIKNVWKNFKQYVELSEKIPAFPPTDCLDNNNPFFKQSIPRILVYDLEHSLFDLNKDFFKYEIGTKTGRYSNIFLPNIKYPCKYFSLVPHTDIPFNGFKNILVANIWISSGYNGKTTFWKFKDSYTLSDEYIKYKESIEDPQRIVLYENFSPKDGFEIVGESPAEQGTITVYNGNQLHSAWVPPDINHKRVSQVITIR
jgi:hypothetical protein